MKLIKQDCGSSNNYFKDKLREEQTGLRTKRSFCDILASFPPFQERNQHGARALISHFKPDARFPRNFL